MPSEESNSGPELLVTLRREPGAPGLGRQLERAVRETIRDGRLRAGDRLPPTRALAADLGVSRRVVVEAFDQLAAEGWLEARVGAGTFVRQLGSPPARQPSLTGRAAISGWAPPAQRRAPARFDFFPGHPDLAAFPRAEWARLTRRALCELPDHALGYGDPRGLRELRVAVAAMLARTRGVVCRPRQVIVCQGVVQALGLLMHAGARGSGQPVRIAVEDPYLPEHRNVLAHHGADVVPIPVDELGVRDQALTASGSDTVLLTPAHQNPTGAVLSPARRVTLARWAQERDGLVIEDDYDAEYRYNRAPIAALQPLAPEHIVYLGSTSKTLAPGLRLAWMLVPESRLDKLAEAKRYADAGSPVIAQATLARLLDSGGYDRHVRAARRRQATRRQALITAAAAHLPQAHVDGAAGGLHVLLRLPHPLLASDLSTACQRHEVRIYPLSAFYADPPPETSALVMGYGTLTPEAIIEGIRRLGLVIQELC